ncbi:MAG: hypothetical protein ACTSX9_03980, partial [Candidatus Njordarchaeales archaeon]
LSLIMRLFNPVLNCVRNYGVLEMAILVRNRRPKPTIRRELLLTYYILRGISDEPKTIWGIYKYVKMHEPEITHMTIYNKVDELRLMGLVRTKEIINEKRRKIIVELSNKGQLLLNSLKELFS